MSRIVANSFKAIAYAIIFVIIWSVGFYLFRAYALNNKMESIVASMESEVSKHNYLTNEAYTMYESMLENMADDMNNGSTFIRGYRINYNHPCDMTLPVGTSLTYSTQLDTPADYGDVAIIELSVTVNAVDLFYDPSPDGAANAIGIRDGDDGVGVTFTYTSQVPCLKYISVTS